MKLAISFVSLYLIFSLFIFSFPLPAVEITFHYDPQLVLLTSQNGLVPKRKQNESTYKYEPEVTELVGVLGTRVYPGPPNWESIKAGDRAERIWHVKLKKPITVLGDDDPTSQNEKETGVKEIQLIVVSDGLAAKLRKHMGATILFRGTLTHAITGHHHLPIMMEVQSCKVQ